MSGMRSDNQGEPDSVRPQFAFYQSSVGPGQEFISKIEMLATFYRGRTSFTELMNLPLSYINALYRIAEQKMKDEEARKQLEAEQMEDGLEEAMTP